MVEKNDKTKNGRDFFSNDSMNDCLTEGMSSMEWKFEIHFETQVSCITNQVAFLHRRMPCFLSYACVWDHRIWPRLPHPHLFICIFGPLHSLLTAATGQLHGELHRGSIAKSIPLH
jgi:hypothetical protein